MRTWPLVFLALLAGCTSTAPADSPGSSSSTSATAPAVVAPTPPEPPFVDGRFVHTADGVRIRVRLGLRGRWSLTSVVAEGAGHLVTDDRWFEGTLGMHRIDAEGERVASWASTGPALVAPDGSSAWVSLVAPESGETGPTLIHTSERVQDVGPLITPVLESYDGEVVAFTALRKEGRDYVRRAFTTDLVAPPRPVSG